MTLFSTLRLRIAGLMAALVLLAGCQEALYSDLGEAEANEMVALLVLSGISAERQRDKSMTYSVMVDPADLAVAVTVLKNSGLPRQRFSSLGEVFGDTGVVGTPFEERVRFTFATNEELARTITQIKGIDTARVHVVIPPEERFGRSGDPARASVAIFHDSTFQPSQYLGRIKTLVAFAVPDLEVENVSASFFPTPGFVVEVVPDPTLPGAVEASVPGAVAARVPGRSSGIPFFDIGLVLVLIIMVRVLMLGWRRLFRSA